MAGVAKPFYVIRNFVGNPVDTEGQMDEWMNEKQRGGYDLTSMEASQYNGTSVLTVVMNVRPRKKPSTTEDE